MVDSKARMQSWIFPCGTTYLNDYQLPPLSGTHRTVYKEKRKYTEKKPVQPMKDTQTLSEIKAAAVPFDLMIKRKDIIGTHPRMRVKKTNVSDVDTGLEEAIKTRPRLIMPPALAVDDFADKHAREILITDFYTSSTARMFQQAVKPSLSVMAPLVEDPAPALPLVLPSLQLPKVPMEWKMETITWDGKQLRGVTDPDKEFWKDHQAKMKECSACNVSRLVKNQRDLQRMMNSARR